MNTLEYIRVIYQLNEIITIISGMKIEEALKIIEMEMSECKTLEKTLEKTSENIYGLQTMELLNELFTLALPLRKKVQQLRLDLNGSIN